MNILEFAKAARLSTATVSRAFHEPTKVRAQTRAHVLDLARQLGYYPDPGGRALVTGRHEVLGLVWPLEVEGADAPFALRILAALTQNLVALDLDLLICPVNRHLPTTIAHARRTLRRSRCDAWILLYPRRHDELVDVLRESRKPVVCLMGKVQGCPEWKSVLLDQDQWIAESLRRLQAGGARHVLFLGCRQNEPDHEEQLAAFRRLAQERFGRRVSCLPGWPPPAAELEALLAAGKVDAIIGVDAATARAGLTACQQLRLAVPGEMQIVSIDEEPKPDDGSSPLAAFRQPLDAMMACAVDLALGRRSRSRKFEAAFVPGRSLKS